MQVDIDKSANEPVTVEEESRDIEGDKPNIKETGLNDPN